VARFLLWFFTWTAACGKIPTVDNLRRRGMVVVNRCWLCEADGESVDHLLLHCGGSESFVECLLCLVWSVLGHALLGQRVTC
jgi:hypothetical protein